MGTPPEHARLALARREASFLLLYEEILKPPVPVEELLEQFAKVHFFTERPEEVFCLEHDKIWQVYIDMNISKECANYTRAHELGHLRMGHLRIDLKKLTDWQVLQLKLEADYFAYNLLIPEDWTFSACQGNVVNEATVAYLAKLFSVSRDIMRIRLHQLGIYCDLNR